MHKTETLHQRSIRLEPVFERLVRIITSDAQHQEDLLQEMRIIALDAPISDSDNLVITKAKRMARRVYGRRMLDAPRDKQSLPIFSRQTRNFTDVGLNQHGEPEGI